MVVGTAPLRSAPFDINVLDITVLDITVLDNTVLGATQFWNALPGSANRKSRRGRLDARPRWDKLRTQWPDGPPRCEGALKMR